MKFGKLAPQHGKLKLEKYLNLVTLPPPPERLVWSARATRPWGVMVNDTVGDCTVAAAGHLIQGWTANTGSEVTLSDDAIIAAYSAITGYDPNDPSTDAGAVVLDVLSYWRRVGIGGDKLGAFVEITPRHAHGQWDPRMVQAAIYLFGGVDIGFQVSQSAMDQVNRGEMWTLVQDSRILGGHSVAVLDYDPQGLTCVTWGKLQRMSWAFWQTYCDEAWALISKDFLTLGTAPNGFDLKTLLADLIAVGRP